MWNVLNMVRCAFIHIDVQQHQDARISCPKCRISKDRVHLWSLWVNGAFVAGLHELKVEHGHSPRFRGV